MSVMLSVTKNVQPPNSAPRIAIVDDHAFMRDLIARALTRTARPYEVVAAVGTAAEAISVCRRFQPDLLVLDINLPDATGVATVPTIRRVSPGTRVLLCTAFPKEDWLDKASTCGADGFVEKTNTWDDFLTAVDRVTLGQRYFCSSGRPAAPPQQSAIAAHLSRREREILELIGNGMTTKEIAAKLFISIPTVETHRANLMTKTLARNVAGLVRFAVKAGLTHD